MSGSVRRERMAALVLIVAGAGLLLFSTGRTWADAVVTMPEPLPVQHRGISGAALVPLAAAMGWAGLAGVAGVIATRGLGRVFVGAFLLVVGVAAVAVVPGGLSHANVVEAAGGGTAVPEAAVAATTTLWWAGAVAGGVLMAIAGLFACVRGRAWPGMSSRYDRPRSGAAEAAGASAAEDMWASMDRGADPTDEPAGGPGEARVATPEQGPSKEQ
ncbi:MAG: MFS transporter [Streptosporangiales bacterium]|nr:MFS transporter [Streptosporangiales bacterium]